jgi:hypothetical protein
LSTTASDEPSVSTEKVLKRQKKQSRREAKLMLVIKEAKRDLKKAQKQQLKAQVRLEKRSTSLHTLEARLAELRASSSQAASDAISPEATGEHQQAQAELESSIARSDEKEQTLSDREYRNAITSLTDQILASPHVEGGISGVSFSSETGRSTSTDAEPTPLLGEEATPPEGTVAIEDTTEGEAMQGNETAVERAPAATPPRRRSAPTTAAVRTSTATKRPANRSQRTKKPSTDTGHEE